MSIRPPLSLVVALFLCVASTTGAAADWPTKTLRFVVPYPVGGGVDLLARMVGPKVSEVAKPLTELPAEPNQALLRSQEQLLAS